MECLYNILNQSLREVENICINDNSIQNLSTLIKK